MITQTIRSTSFAEKVSLSPLRDRAVGREDLRQAAVRTDGVVSAHTRISVALAELVEHGIDVTRLDLKAMAEAGQRLRRARAL